MDVVHNATRQKTFVTKVSRLDQPNGQIHRRIRVESARDENARFREEAVEHVLTTAQACELVHELADDLNLTILTKGLEDA